MGLDWIGLAFINGQVLKMRGLQIIADYNHYYEVGSIYKFITLEQKFIKGERGEFIAFHAIRRKGELLEL